IARALRRRDVAVAYVAVACIARGPLRIARSGIAVHVASRSAVLVLPALVAELPRMERLFHAGSSAAPLAARLARRFGEPAAQYGRAESGFCVGIACGRRALARATARPLLCIPLAASLARALALALAATAARRTRARGAALACAGAPRAARLARFRRRAAPAVVADAVERGELAGFLVARAGPGLLR